MGGENLYKQRENERAPERKNVVDQVTGRSDWQVCYETQVEQFCWHIGTTETRSKNKDGQVQTALGYKFGTNKFGH